MARKKAAKKTEAQPPIDNDHVEPGAEKFSESIAPLTSENVKGNVYRADMGESLPPQVDANPDRAK